MHVNELAIITAPVSRHLDVTDVAASVRYYRDVLGFEVRRDVTSAGEPAEVVRGPARLTLGASTHASITARATVFLEVSDVSAMRDALMAGGALPSDIDDVNHIKIRLFAVHDPDSNLLLFGRSFAAPNEPVGQQSLRKVMPELPLTDVPAGVAHYRDVLGFSINHQQADLGVMDRDGMRLLLIGRTERHSGIGSCCFYVRDADALHAELTAKGANVMGEPVSQPWGLREFRVLDPEGNRLSFAQTFE